jgi:hypothetical protein
MSSNGSDVYRDKDGYLYLLATDYYDGMDVNPTSGHVLFSNLQQLLDGVNAKCAAAGGRLKVLEINTHGNPDSMFLGHDARSTLPPRWYRSGQPNPNYVNPWKNTPRANEEWYGNAAGMGPRIKPDYNKIKLIGSENIELVAPKIAELPWARGERGKNLGRIYLTGCNTGLLKGANTWPQRLADITGAEVWATEGYCSGAWLHGGDNPPKVSFHDRDTRGTDNYSEKDYRKPSMVGVWYRFKPGEGAAAPPVPGAAPAPPSGKGG